ncbi:MAG: flagellar biosynthesis protein FlgM [Acidobacteria bacterium]|nr:MAG: flagellar biosynthesis protein FlgM [Acidobacteriota bacterium]REK08885.1 MAG: flagellar biosynthesis protein FlgM [Acidobacteriota bacterium]
MRWRGRQQSRNVEDRRGRGRGGGMRLPSGTGGRVGSIGCGGLLLVIVFAVLTGNDPAALLQLLSGASAPSADVGLPPADAAPPSDELGQFAAVVLRSTEEIWHEAFPQLGLQYQEPGLVLFTDSVDSDCGFNSAAVGPFYCPADRKIYIDLSFFDQLSRRFGAPGDFAQAYVIAHEVGHHVQNLLGISTQVRQMQARTSREQANQLSVRLELQADCLAGFWAAQAHRRQALLEPGDVEEGLRAAAAIGDDNIQKRSQGYVVPESWTHGSSEQRQHWLREGLASSDIRQACETFSDQGF